MRREYAKGGRKNQSWKRLVNKTQHYCSLCKSSCLLRFDNRYNVWHVKKFMEAFFKRLEASPPLQKQEELELLHKLMDEPQELDESFQDFWFSNSEYGIILNILKHKRIREPEPYEGNKGRRNKVRLGDDNRLYYTQASMLVQGQGGVMNGVYRNFDREKYGTIMTGRNEELDHLFKNMRVYDRKLMNVY